MTGIGGSGTISPAPGQISWYTGSPTPGRAGISVMLGHVTYNGPDVFYYLDRIGYGATVTVRQANGGTSTWRVSNKFSVNKNAAMYDPRIWGGSSTPEIALVTCDPLSRWVNAQHHANNYVVILTPA